MFPLAHDKSCGHGGRSIGCEDPLFSGTGGVFTLSGSLAVARGAAKGNPAVSEQVLQAARSVLDELMLAHPHARAPARRDDRPAA